MFHNTTGRYWGNVTIYGYDQTNSLWWWGDGSNYYISEIPGIPITIDAGQNYNPSGFLYNGQYYYDVAIGYLWYDSYLTKWIISSAIGYKTDEYSTEINGVTTWYGDAWWSSSSSSIVGSYTARGSGHGGTSKTVALGKVIGWKSASQYGVYTPETGSGLTGDKYAGWLTFKDVAHATSPYKQVTITVTTITGETSETTITIVNSYITGQTNAGTIVTVDGNTTTTVKTEVFGGSNIVTSLEYFTDSGTLYNSKPLFSGTNKKLWHDGSNWIISEAAGTKDIKAGYWSGSSIPGTLSRQWETTVPPVTDPVTPDPLDTDRNAYNITRHEYNSTTRQVSHLIAQVALWL